jgi:hypothetical protein
MLDDNFFPYLGLGDDERVHITLHVLSNKRWIQCLANCTHKHQAVTHSHIQ